MVRIAACRVPVWWRPAEDASADPHKSWSQSWSCEATRPAAPALPPRSVSVCPTVRRVCVTSEPPTAPESTCPKRHLASDGGGPSGVRSDT